MGAKIYCLLHFLLRAATMISFFAESSITVTAMNGDEMGEMFEGDINLQGETMVMMGDDKMVMMPRKESRQWPSKIIPVAISPRFGKFFTVAFVVMRLNQFSVD